MIATFIHRIDPVIAEVSGLYLWWYGLSYATGFLSLHLWLRRARNRLQLSLTAVYQLTLFLVIGVLLGGRLVEVLFYEWRFYRWHPGLIPWLWLGGMATHGLLLGGVLAAALFCRLHRMPLLALLDELAVPAALLMGLGRIGNFIDGQIVGSITTVPWAVKLPDAAGFRHPVVLYDGLKNLLLVPLLLWIRKTNPRRGVLTANFIFWYAFLRIFVDVFREYPTTLLGLATGQSLNLWMAVAGLTLLIWCARKPAPAPNAPGPTTEGDAPSSPLSQATRTGADGAAPSGRWDIHPRPLLFAALLLFCLTIPSDWTQDVPARYGKRHPGISYSRLYCRLDDATHQ